MNNLLFVLPMLASLLGGTAVKEASIAYKNVNFNAPNSVTLNLLNVEDYIYEKNVEEGYTNENLTKQFEDYASEVLGVSVKVNYSTTDTPESMFNEVKISPNKYDLICPSDYMIQKLIVNNMVTKMNIDEEHMPNYLHNASRTIKGILDNISAVNGSTNETCYLKDYAVGYMWGTLGLLFDAEYGGREAETMITDMRDWSILWNPDYKGISSIKDSVRDTYAIGLLHALNDDFEENGNLVEGFETLMEKHVSGEYSDEEYNALFSELFNRCDDGTLEKVRKSLTSLKGNVFGMEVDSGKQDIVTGKIGINFAWSGDAVYSMEQALDEKDLTLYYSIPRTGSNLWMDAWCRVRNDRNNDALVTKVSELFLDFLSMPEITSQNMDFTGYTPFTAGNDILDLVHEWYDYRYDEDTETFDNRQYTDEEMEELEIQRVDLSYFFKDTLTGEYAEDDYACIFYSDSYLPFTYENEDGEEVMNECVGTDFFCQFPSQETLVRCAVMRDFGPQNDAVLKMWEKFKSDALPTWAIVLFIVEGVIGAGAIAYYFASRAIKTSLRKKRKEELAKK